MAVITIAACTLQYMQRYTCAAVSPTQKISLLSDLVLVGLVCTTENYYHTDLCHSRPDWQLTLLFEYHPHASYVTSHLPRHDDDRKH